MTGELPPQTMDELTQLKCENIQLKKEHEHAINQLKLEQEHTISQLKLEHIESQRPVATAMIPVILSPDLSNDNL